MTVQLFCGDCLEIMPALGRVDAVVTDPPYSIGISNNPIRQKTPKKRMGLRRRRIGAYKSDFKQFG